MIDPATILVVEDDEALLAGIADLLEVSDIGYEVQVLTATDGSGGLDVVGERTPDLIISDIMMPRMGGYEFLDELRKNPSWMHIPVIFLTARGTKDDIHEGRLSGAELYITKPYESDELIHLVQSQLERTFQLQLDRERRLQLLRSNIVQVLNHEFRTPLTYVTAYYDLLAEGLLSEDINLLWEYLRGIQVGASRLKRLVDDLIKVLELRTGAMAVRYERHARPIRDLGESLILLCAQFRRKYESQGVRFHCLVPEVLPPVHGDKDSLLDACERIIDNAVKFSVHQSDGAEVRIAARAVKDELWITIEDNGVGLPEGESKQIFDLFYQYNRPVLEQQGAGTGLTIARGLIELHQGRIEVASEEGKGSAFTILLPVSAARNGQSASTGPSSRVTLATLLIVEDELHLLEGLRDLLELMDSNYQLTIMTASSGREALRKLNQQPVDLIISDIKMPGMDGHTLVKRVRSINDWVHIPVIFLTAKSDYEDIMRGRRGGVWQ